MVTPAPEKQPEKEFPGIGAGDLKKNTGKHVVIVDGKIIAAARDAKHAIAKVKKKHPNKKIILRYVANEKLILKCRCAKK